MVAGFLFSFFDCGFEPGSVLWSVVFGPDLVVYSVNFMPCLVGLRLFPGVLSVLRFCYFVSWFFFLCGVFYHHLIQLGCIAGCG